MNRKAKIQAVHALKEKGYRNGQIGERENMSEKTVRRLLKINPEHLCVDGTQLINRGSFLDPYKEWIIDYLDQGFAPSQIRKQLQIRYPDKEFKRSTVGGYCNRLKKEFFEITEDLSDVDPISNASILFPYREMVKKQIAEGHTIQSIFEEIQNLGYTGSYSLLQQYGLQIKPKAHTKKKPFKTVSRKELTGVIWQKAGGHVLSDTVAGTTTELSSTDLAYIQTQFPECSEIEAIIFEFRSAFSAKDSVQIKDWVHKYKKSPFESIKSFIQGIYKDSDAFYNSLKYEYNNGLLEGSVNKLKAVKRSMYGRASYSLLRAKLLLGDHIECF